METVLKFNLDNREDKMAHMRCLKSEDMALALWKLSNLMEKFADEAVDSDGEYLLDVICEYVNDILFLHSIDLNELTEQLWKDQN